MIPWNSFWRQNRRIPSETEDKLQAAFRSIEKNTGKHQAEQLVGFCPGENAGIQKAQQPVIIP